MAKKKVSLSDEAIAALLETAIGESVGYEDSELSKERENVQRYYDGELPRQSHKGNSKYISNDVYDKVEGMKASLLETFAAGNNIGEFNAMAADDVENARVQTEYCDWVLFRKNPGYTLFSDLIHNGLTARIGVIKFFWHEEEKEIEETLDAVNMDTLDRVLNDPEVDLKELTEDTDEEGNTVYGATLVRKTKESYCKLKVLPPENFGCEAKVDCLEKAFVYHREQKTRSELNAEYDESKVAEIGSGDEGFQHDAETLARFDKIGASSIGDIDALQEATEKVWVYECYVDLDVDGSGKAKLWKVTKAGGVVLDKEQVKQKPFLVFAPLRKPHSIIGSNYAAKMIPTQNSRTVLIRGILDHTVTTNNPRFKVIKGSLANPAELMDNRVGGIVNVSRPDGVLPFEQPSLNPFVFQTVQLIDYDSEETSSLSQLSQGLNKDALSKQNSQGMVENLTSLAMQRQKIIARNFAEQIVKPLFIVISQMALENESNEVFSNVTGNVLQVDMKTWRDRQDFTITLKLGYGEQAKEVDKWMTMDALLSTPQSAALYPLEKKHAVLSKAFAAKGIKDIDTYILRPEQVKPPQPDPLMVAQTKLLEVEAQTKLIEAEAKLLTAQAAKKSLEDKAATAAAKLQSDHAFKGDKLDLEERQQDHSEYVAEAELAVMAKAEEVRAIASPS